MVHLMWFQNQPLSQACQSLLEKVRTSTPQQQEEPEGKIRQPPSIVEGR